MSPSTSSARLEANRANAQLSTGPQTPQGKARAAANSRKHGLCANEVIVNGPEEQAEFDQLLQLNLVEVQPNGSVEQILFDEMIAAAWNLRRVRRLETELCRNLDPIAALDDAALQTKLDRLARHQTRIERTFHRSLKELKALQTERILRLTTEQTQGFTNATPLLSTAEPRKIARPSRVQPAGNAISERTQSISPMHRMASY